eukprot:4726874-Pyramimonas_sp.AAC.1
MWGLPGLPASWASCSMGTAAPRGCLHGEPGAFAAPLKGSSDARRYAGPFFTTHQTTPTQPEGQNLSSISSGGGSGNIEKTHGTRTPPNPKF